MSASVVCPSCGTENEGSQRFCGSCGTALTQICPTCNEQNPGGFRFCGNCGSSLEAPSEPAAGLPDEGERRFATVLFADLSGFTSISEQMDPEDVTTLIDRCMGIMGEIVERYGGTVERIIGDEMLAVFGAPIAHEDDPERAVRAALELGACATEKAEEFHHMPLRIGVNTGEMMFGPVGPGREVTMMGDAVNTAKRLQTAAPRGGTLVGDETYRATRHVVRFEPSISIEAKGKSEPVRAWRPLEPLAAPARRPVSSAPIIGRDAELNLLRQIWSRVEAERRAHLVTVLGPPGIGKTRLSGEFSSALEALGARVLRGRSLPYGESTGYGAFAQQIKQAAGALDTDTAPVAREKLAAAAGQVLPADEAEGVARHMASMMGLESGEEVPERAPLFMAARAFVEALAADRPLVLLFEDIHWADPALLDLIESLASRCTSSAVMVVTLARPELLDRRPGWGGGLTSYSVLPLAALTMDESRDLVRKLLPAVADDEIVGRLAETAGGNPLFLEELSASLSEQASGPARELPTSVTGIIAARLDTLPPPERRLLLDAAVVGKVFWRGALARLGSDGRLDETLDALETKDFVRREPASMIGGDRQYLFKHMLIREVAYGLLPRAARRDRHRAVAKFLEESVGDRVAESASLLAHHWREAGDAVRAVEYLLVAAQQAAKVWAKDEAFSLYQQALELIPASDAEARRDVLLRLGIARTLLGDYEAAARDLDQILDSLSGREHVEALIARSRAAFWLFRGDEGYALGERAVAEARAIGADDLVPPALSCVSLNAAIEEDRVKEALELGEQALALWKPGTYEGDRAVTLAYSGLSAYWAGDYARALDLGAEGYHLAEDIKAMEAFISGGPNYALTLAALGRPEDALKVLAKIIRQGIDLGTAGRFVARARNIRGGVLRELFVLDDARSDNEAAMELAAEVGFAVAQTQGGLDIGWIDLISGDVGAAERRLPQLGEMAAKAAGFHQWLVAMRLAQLTAEVALAKGDLEAAMEHAGRSLARAQKTGRRKYELAARLVRAAVLSSSGTPEEGLEEARSALAIAEEIRAPAQIWRAASGVVAAAAAAGRDDEAAAAASRSSGAVREFAGGLSEARREAFLEAEPIREILSRA